MGHKYKGQCFWHFRCFCASWTDSQWDGLDVNGICFFLVAGKTGSRSLKRPNVKLWFKPLYPQVVGTNRSYHPDGKWGNHHHHLQRPSLCPSVDPLVHSSQDFFCFVFFWIKCKKKCKSCTWKWKPRSQEKKQKPPKEPGEQRLREVELFV